MNIHHLELFYYVATHGGISPAVKKIPYGIQQPAVSSQILQLEEDLQTTLFQRRPFRLTPDGERLYAFVAPFFSKVSETELAIRKSASQRIRIAASSVVSREHLPGVLDQLRRRHPGLHVTLRVFTQTEAQTHLLNREIDLAITVLENKTLPGIRSQSLIKLAPILLAPRSGPWKSATDLFKSGRISAPLVALPASEALCRLFFGELTRRKLEWPVTLEVDSHELIETYAAGGFGLGLTVPVPGKKIDPRLRAIPLTGFPPLEVGILHTGTLSTVARDFCDLALEKARQLGK